MKFHACHFNYLNCRQKNAAGFTLVEMMASVGLGLILLIGVAILYIDGNESFVAMANYQNLDKYSVNALDTISREIRNATAVLATNATSTTKSITFTNATLGQQIQLTFDSSARTLVLTKTSGATTTTTTNLTGCDSWYFTMYNKAPTITATNIIFNGTNNITGCKLIQMNWKCSRTYLGSKLETESVQTAQIVLRNETQ